MVDFGFPARPKQILATQTLETTVKAVVRVMLVLVKREVASQISLKSLWKWIPHSCGMQIGMPG
ncbi:hypothetical protein PC116_g9352 [Phytophthora cactorum]|nr:hypothetical protein PC116_g9352 [Phytophthora cactorum]